METEATDVQDVDSLLPIHAPQAQPESGSSKKLKSVTDTLKRRDWAHEINVNQPFDNFHEMVPELAQHVSMKKNKVCVCIINRC